MSCPAVVCLDEGVYVQCELEDAHDVHQAVEHADPIPAPPGQPLATVEVTLTWST